MSVPPEVREPPTPVKPEPVKQANPKPNLVPIPPPKEKEPTPEPQSTQGKRGKGPREEPAQPAQDTVDDGAAPPQQPQLPAQPQKSTPPPPVQQPISKFTVQVQNAKEKEKKEKTPEPPTQVKSQPTPPQKTSPSPPPVKEPAPPAAASPAATNDEAEVKRESKEKEVNNVECEVNNVHEKEEAVEEEEGDNQEKKEDGPQLKYSYKEDQWSPVNPDGKRQYDRRFLLELQNNPLSLKKPESLPNLEVVRDGPGRPKTFDPRGGSGPDFIPDYVKSSLGNKQPRMVGRGSQQRVREPGAPVPPRSTSGRGGKIIIIQSTGREPKLKTTENAWKPSLKESSSGSDDVQVLKVMKGILNKLTPEKFGKLVDTVKTMPINTTERLSSVIDLIFEKAVDEQSFSSTYAQMCQVLSLMSVRGNGSESNSGKQEVKFRNLIINKCQKEFEKDNTDDFRTERLKEIEACTDPEKKQELEAKLMYDETKLRKRSVGNIRFIGELYKLRMLTSPIMMRIIGTLLERGDEESLECLCKLLTTIGKILETQCAQQPKAMSELDKYFKVMDKIVHERQTVTRVRFLMMDVIDLRQNSWVPRREDNKPKTKAQVQEEVKREEFEQQMALASNPGRRDDRDRDRDRRRLRDNRGPQMSDEGWSTVASTKGRTSFDSSRLKTFSRPGVTEVTLRSNFGDWGRGSSGGGLKDHSENKQQESNRFNVLVDSMGGNSLAGDNRRNTPSMGGNRLAPGSGPARQGSFGSKSMPPLNDKESAISAVKKFVAPDRSKSTSRPESRDNSIPREPEPLRGYAQVDVDALQKVSVAIVDEYTHNSDPEEAKLCVKEKFELNTMKFFVQFSLEWVLDRDSKKRKMVGQLYHDLIMEKLLTVEQLLEGSQENLGNVEDFLIDIPQVCDYLGEIFAPCLNDNAVSIHRLVDLAQYAGNKKAHIFASILSKAAMIMSPNKVSDLWNSSGISWTSMLPPSANIDDFLTKHQVEFTVDRNKTGNHSGWNPQKVESEFLTLFKRASNDEIFGWIDANIGNDAKSSKFIRALVTALVESQAATSNDGSSIRVSEDFEEKMKNRLAVVLKYVDGNEMLEMQCIYALQALCVKHQYPQGLLEKCFNAFYDSEVVSEEAFEEWVNSKDPEEQEGKGVCITSVQSFMRWLKEADEEG